MTNKRISELAQASPLDYTELMVLVQKGINVQQNIGDAFPEVFRFDMYDTRSEAVVTANNLIQMTAPFPFYIISGLFEVATAPSSPGIGIFLNKNGSGIMGSVFTISAGQTNSIPNGFAFNSTAARTFAKGDLLQGGVVPTPGTGATRLQGWLTVRRMGMGT